MLSIGDFARLGQVSVRMLRHYDGIGLLRPARVDAGTGYRRYAVAQLARLNRVIALHDLGFTLDQVAVILDDQLGVEELRGMLRLRRAELAAEHRQAQQRLAGVERRLHLIEKEHRMSEVEYVVKALPAHRLAAGRASAGSQEEFATVLGPLFGRVAGAVAATGTRPGLPVAVYEMAEEEICLVVGYEYAGPDVAGDGRAGSDAPGSGAAGFEVVTLARVPDAVCAVHLGPMATIGDSWQQLVRWVDDHGWTPAGAGREVYLRATPLDDQAEWVTELQQPVVRAG